MEGAEEIEIVIVGAGICGLAISLALHRKGIKSAVLERSETVRSTGAAIGIHTNGWRPLEELGLASKLRQTADIVHGTQEIWLDTGKQHEDQSLSHREARFLRRSDIVTALAESLPEGTLRLGCQLVSIQLDPLTSFPILYLQNGQVIKAKVLIGCDGAHSVVSNFLGLKPPKLFPQWAVRGFTNYPNGHGFPSIFQRLYRKNAIFGRVPIDSKLIYWFFGQKGNLYESTTDRKNPEVIQKLTLESAKEFPAEALDIITNCDRESLSLTHLRYRASWDILLRKFNSGTVTVAGDAMHVMVPYIGQGGSSALEDAIVLVRCLAKRLNEVWSSRSGQQTFLKKVGEAFDSYVKERRMRLVNLSIRSYIIGLLIVSSSLKKLACVLLMVLFFSDLAGHTYYDCGSL